MAALTYQKQGSLDYMLLTDLGNIVNDTMLDPYEYRSWSNKIPNFNDRGLLPPGDYEVTFGELRNSILVNGPSPKKNSNWDSKWRLKLIANCEILVNQLYQTGIMIRTDAEYKRALERLDNDLETIKKQKEKLIEMELSEEEISRAMQPLLSFHEQLKEEVEAYEKLKRGDFGTLYSLNSIGRWLTGLRIAKGWTQAELASRLGVTQAQVSRDENNEYHGISLEKAQRILEVFKARIRVEIEDPV